MASGAYTNIPGMCLSKSDAPAYPGFLNHFYLDVDMCMCKRILPRLLITGYKQLKQVMLIIIVNRCGSQRYKAV